MGYVVFLTVQPHKTPLVVLTSAYAANISLNNNTLGAWKVRTSCLVCGSIINQPKPLAHVPPPGLNSSPLGSLGLTTVDLATRLESLEEHASIEEAVWGTPQTSAFWENIQEQCVTHWWW